MERIQRIATHDGTVVAVHSNMVDVQIVATSACAACAAHAKCGFAESKNKTVSVPLSQSANQSFNIGDPVRVHIDQSRGMLAVWIAYVLPAILMLGAIVGLSVAGVAESLVALAALAVLGLYVLVLFLVRRHIEGRFTLTIEPLTTDN